VITRGCPKLLHVLVHLSAQICQVFFEAARICIHQLVQCTAERLIRMPGVNLCRLHFELEILCE